MLNSIENSERRRERERYRHRVKRMNERHKKGVQYVNRDIERERLKKPSEAFFGTVNILKQREK